MSFNFKDAYFRVGTGLHEGIFKLTNGRVANRFYGMPVVMLTTTGRKSGKARTTMLTSPVQVDGSVVLVASYGGDDRNPTWFLNLRDDPDVEIVMKGKRQKMTARVASPEEKDELWPKVVKGYSGYGQYQTKTEREIPVVILDPRESAK